MSEYVDTTSDGRTAAPGRTAMALVIVVVLGATGIWLAGWTRSNYANPERFYVHSLPPAERTPPLSNRVVLVVSDGLRDDVARSLPTISSLARRPDSSFRRSVTGIPSLSRPGSISLLCGVGPEQSGFPLNESKGSVEVECLFDTVAEAGLTSAVGGVGEGFSDRFHPPKTRVFTRQRSDDVSAYVPDDHESFQLSVQALATGSEFVYLYFPDVDEESHLHGALSRQALDAARIFDRFVDEIARSLDFSRDTLVVTSDHGHRDEGGHGGYEWLARHSPLLMVGRGISGGSTADVSQTDIAPTVAALLGVPRPRHAEGMPLLDDLDASLDLKETVRRAQESALRRKLQADLAGLRGSPQAPGEVDLIQEQIAEAGWARGVREAVRRVPLALLLLAILAASMAVAGAWRREALLGGMVATGIFAFSIWATGWRLTISQFNVPSDEGRLTWSLIGSAAAGIVVGSLVSRVGGRLRSGPKLPYSRNVVATAAAAQGIGGILLAWMLVYYGLKYSWRLLDLRLGLATFWALYASGFAGLTAAALVGVSGLLSLGRTRRISEPATTVAAATGAGSLTVERESAEPEDEAR